ncbi:MAG TPA: twitching motility protein PilT [Candidatus Spyradocola merdavium]|nr:twitching motility protein PilT [Candidatus Spyradocola merdavium]
MIRIIYGKKGSGKTKKIIDAANEAVKSSTGELVFIDDDNRYMYDLRHEIRFVNATEYDVSSPDTFMGFICGILAGNYDMKQLFIDGFLRLVKSEMADLEPFFVKLEDITHRHGVDVVISASAKDDTVPEFLKKYIVD